MSYYVIDWFLFFFFNDTATTEIYTLSLHDALPISSGVQGSLPPRAVGGAAGVRALPGAVPQRRRSAAPRPAGRDRKSTRLNSSHANISYAVFCLKKKKTHVLNLPYIFTYIFLIQST